MILEQAKWLNEKFVAHRGLFNNKDIPENSIPAFRKASENNFGIEMDVQMTIDGKLVVFHDDNLKRMTGIDALIQEQTFDYVRSLKLLDTDCIIPTFEEFLEAANGTNLIVEIKTHKHIGETEQKVYEALKSYKGHYCIESFNPFIVRWFKVHAPEVIRGTLAYDYSDMKNRCRAHLLSHLKLCKWNGSQFIAYDARTLHNNKDVMNFRKKIPVVCWTVKSQEEYERLKDDFDVMIFDSFVPIRYDLQK